jgi:excisionase family DNA binding protein
MDEKINLSISETVVRSGLGRTTIFSLLKTGELESIKFGARRLVPVDALHACMEKRRAEQNQPRGEAA